MALSLSLGRSAVCRPALTARGRVALAPLTSRPARQNVRMAAASGSSDDFDALLIKIADKWDKAENKPVVAAYIAGAAAAILTAEWLIHLPGLNILLGFPVQLLGLLALPVLGVKYFIEGDDFGKDAEAATAKIVAQLPGLGKK